MSPSGPSFWEIEAPEPEDCRSSLVLSDQSLATLDLDFDYDRPPLAHIGHLSSALGDKPSTARTQRNRGHSLLQRIPTATRFTRRPLIMEATVISFIRWEHF